MRKIQDFLDMKKQYEAKLWDDQIGFFLLTLFFILIQLLNSWKIFLGSIIIEICLLIICSRMERKQYGSVLCSFIHGVIWGIITFIDGWSFIWLMKEPNNYSMIGVIGTILILICYCVRILLTRKRIRDGWYEKRKKRVSYGSELASAVAIMTVATMRICGKQLGLEGIGHNEICLGLSIIFFVIAIFTSLWVDAGMMYYYYVKSQTE